MPGGCCAGPPIGIFRDVDRPAYDDLARAQVRAAQGETPPVTDADLQALINGNDTWTLG